MRTNAKGLSIIKDFEGLKLVAYTDIVGIPTIGYGCTHGVTLDDVKNKRTITQAQAEDMLKNEIGQFEKGVASLISAQINDNQFSALVSFAYNLGLGSLKKSTLLKLVNSGDNAAAADEFPKWNKAGGQEVPGLTRRRNAEKALFLTSADDEVQSNILPDGPSDDEIDAKLEDIEKEASKMT